MKAIILFLLLFLVSCSKQKDEFGELATGAQTVQAEVPKPAVEPGKIAELKKYVYPNAQERDPFVPLIGNGKYASAGAGDSKSIINNLADLELKGILKDRRGKVALIGCSGESYTLRSGRIYDRRNRVINEVTGIIKENSIVLISQNKAVKELQLKKEAEPTTVK